MNKTVDKVISRIDTNRYHGNKAVMFAEAATPKERGEFFTEYYENDFGKWEPKALAEEFGIEAHMPEGKRTYWLAGAHCKGLGARIAEAGSSITEAIEKLAARILIQNWLEEIKG